MKLLLDEMLPDVIARQLRERGRDAVAVDGLSALRGLVDPELFEWAQREARVIVTYNRDDFLALDRSYRSSGRDHHGIVVLNPRRFPQGAGTLGRLIDALDAFAAGEAPYPGFVHWLG